MSIAVSLFFDVKAGIYKHTNSFSWNSYIFQFLSSWDYSFFHNETTLAFWRTARNFLQSFFNHIVLSCFSVFCSITFLPYAHRQLYLLLMEFGFVCGWILQYFKGNAYLLDHQLNNEEISTPENTYVMEIMYRTCWGISKFG